MMKYRGRGVAMLLVAALLTAMLAITVSAGENNSHFQKTVDSYTANSGEDFVLTSSSRFFIVSGSAPAADSELLQTVKLLSSEFAAQNKPSAEPLAIVWGPESYAKTGDIIVRLDTGLNYDHEEYEVVVRSDMAVVQANDPDGILYGLRFLLKNLILNGGNRIGSCTVHDVPDTRERTVMLDCARKYYSKEWIKNFIREMSWMGYNAIELHIADDGGFRADVWDPAYFTSPNGNDYTWLCGGESAYWVYGSYNNYGEYAEKSENQTKYLSAADLIEIFDTAKEYHLAVIPSLDVPGHTEYMNTKYYNKAKNDSSFSFTYDGITYYRNGVSDHGTWKDYATAFPNGVNTNFYRINYGNKDPNNSATDSALDVANPVARAFSLSVIQDFALFFQKYAGSTDFNIGTDEVDMNLYGNGWNTYAQRNGFGSSIYDAFLEYINTVNRCVRNCGYTARAFNDCLYLSGYDFSSRNVDLDTNIEIVYWDNIEARTGSAYYNNHNATSPYEFLNRNHIMYNAISCYNYYVLRYCYNNGKDALDPTNNWWSFCRATAEHNYAEWNPSRMYEDNASSPVVNDARLGGGYFLIWCDFAGYKTEEQVWNGKDANGTYNVIERMWANSAKMWKWNLNSQLSFNDFQQMWKKLQYFPGYTSCSAAARLTEAKEVEPAYFADHSTLAQLLKNKERPELYTEASYQNYLNAYAAAAAVHERYDATQAQVDEAVAALRSAISALENRGMPLKLQFKVRYGDRTAEIGAKTEYVTANKNYLIHIPAMTGYRFSSVEGDAVYSPATNGASFGTLSGKVSSEETITIWYESQPQLELLRRLLQNAEQTNSKGYTEATWQCYHAARVEAQSFYDSVAGNPAECTHQNEVNRYVLKLLQAISQLALSSAETTVDVKLATAYVAAGKEAVLLVTASPDVTEIAVQDEQGNVVTLTECCAEIMQTQAGESVKLWYVSFYVQTARENPYRYTVQAVGTKTVTEDVMVPCR